MNTLNYMRSPANSNALIFVHCSFCGDRFRRVRRQLKTKKYGIRSNFRPRITNVCSKECANHLDRLERAGEVGRYK